MSAVNSGEEVFTRFTLLGGYEMELEFPDACEDSIQWIFRSAIRIIKILNNMQ